MGGKILRSRCTLRNKLSAFSINEKITKVHTKLKDHLDRRTDDNSAKKLGNSDTGISMIN